MPKLPPGISPEEWEAMSYERRLELIQSDGKKEFNYQKSDRIEWARWSWNPVTGCLNDCPYCYARDRANRHYSEGFRPSFHPERLTAPRNTRPKGPKPGWTDIDILGHKNVFTVSMGDLFGKWVPVEWIFSVLGQIQANPQWNYLLLTKFPMRMAQFELPPNVWAGVSVDSQKAIQGAEKAFEKAQAGVKFLSCEPMRERLTFNRLNLFDWIVMGGASPSSATGGTSATCAMSPPIEWVDHLCIQALRAGIPIYQKTNLFCDSARKRIREYPGHPTQH